MNDTVDRVEHRGGVDWWKAPKPFRIHRHRWQTRGYTTTGVTVDRCACGAIEFSDDAAGWTFIGKDKPRVWP